MKLGFTAWETSALMRKLLAYIWEMQFAPHLPLENTSQMRSSVLGRRFECAPCRSREPISSSSKQPTSLMVPESTSEPLDEINASMAAKEHSLSSTRPAKMNSFSKPPSWAGWVSKSSSSQLMIVLSMEVCQSIGWYRTRGMPTVCDVHLSRYSLDQSLWLRRCESSCSTQ